MNAVTTTEPAGSALMSFIERAARDPDFDLEKFSALLRMQREVELEQAKRAFNRAMAACQAEMTPVLRTSQNKHIGNKYAKLEAIDQQMRPVYTRHGFSIRFGSAPAPRDGDMRIICIVAHNDGYSEENYLDAPVSTLGTQGGRMATTPVQAVGSVSTYLRRYLMALCFNLVMADEDDDGEGVRPGQLDPVPLDRSDAQARNRQSGRAPRSGNTMDPVRGMQRARAEMDETLHDDDIPDFDAPKPDGARADANRLKGWLAAVTTQAQWDKLWANAGVNAVREKIRAERIELDAELTVAEDEARSRIANVAVPVDAQAEPSA